MADSNNPYAPPTATVADTVPIGSADFQPVKIFGTKGRIGRLRYVAYLFGVNFILGIAMWAIVMVLGVALGVSMAVRGGDNAQIEQIHAIGMTVWGIWAIVAILYLIFHVRLSIQRSHDMNLSGWTVLLTFIPFVGLYWVFKPGTKGANRFGLPPPPNSSGVKVLFGIGIFFVVIGFLLGILAALAIPAYVQHAQTIQSQKLQR